MEGYHNAMIPAESFCLLKSKRTNIGFGLPGLELQSENGDPVTIAEHATLGSESNAFRMTPGMPLLDGSDHNIIYCGLGKPKTGNDFFLYCLGGPKQVNCTSAIFKFIPNKLISLIWFSGNCWPRQRWFSVEPSDKTQDQWENFHVRRSLWSLSNRWNLTWSPDKQEHSEPDASLLHLRFTWL